MRGGWTVTSSPRARLRSLALPAALFAAVWLCYLPGNMGYTPGFHGGNPFVAEALAGDLISPGRGLFIYSPVLVFSVVGFALKVTSRRLMMLDLTLAGCVTVHWIAIARVNRAWWAGHSYGPRFFADMLPYGPLTAEDAESAWFDKLTMSGRSS
jgi:hypothetical protein